MTKLDAIADPFSCPAPPHATLVNRLIPAADVIARGNWLMASKGTAQRFGVVRVASRQFKFSRRWQRQYQEKNRDTPRPRVAPASGIAGRGKDSRRIN